MLPDVDVWRADQLLDEGDMAGAETWHQILNAIERLQAKAPAADGKALTGGAPSALSTLRPALGARLSLGLGRRGSRRGSSGLLRQIVGNLANAPAICRTATIIACCSVIGWL
jgi:hypothetical protein